MEQGKIITKSFDQLVLRQAIGCETSYLEQGEKHPRR